MLLAKPLNWLVANDRAGMTVAGTAALTANHLRQSLRQLRRCLDSARVIKPGHLMA